MVEEKPKAVLDEALTFFMRYYRAHALEHTRFYPGIKDAIERLAHNGNALGVLTNKPVRISRDILTALGVGPLFFRVYGGDSFPAKKPDPIGVATLISEASKQAAETVLVGDSGVDVQTARNAGVRSVGVAWGFQPEAFEIFPPDLVVQQPEDLLRML